MKSFWFVLALSILVAACGDGDDDVSCRDCNKTAEPDGVSEPELSAREMEQQLDEIEREISSDAGR